MRVLYRYGTILYCWVSLVSVVASYTLSYKYLIFMSASMQLYSKCIISVKSYFFSKLLFLRWFYFPFGIWACYLLHKTYKVVGKIVLPSPQKNSRVKSISGILTKSIFSVMSVRLVWGLFLRWPSHSKKVFTLLQLPNILESRKAFSRSRSNRCKNWQYHPPDIFSLNCRL